MLEGANVGAIIIVQVEDWPETPLGPLQQGVVAGVHEALWVVGMANAWISSVNMFFLHGQPVVHKPEHMACFMQQNTSVFIAIVRGGLECEINWLSESSAPVCVWKEGNVGWVLPARGNRVAIPAVAVKIQEGKRERPRVYGYSKGKEGLESTFARPIGLG